MTLMIKWVNKRLIQTKARVLAEVCHVVLRERALSLNVSNFQSFYAALSDFAKQHASR